MALALLLGASLACAAAPERRETVFLLHGMGRTRASMAVLAWRLRRAGYRTVNVPYGHLGSSLDEATEGVRRLVEGVGVPRYHFVGHSLGNVIVRNGFRKGWPPGLGRVVMLAPPNSSPALARRLKDAPPYRWATGESGRRLADPGFYATLPVPTAEFAVISGDRGQSLTFDEPNDGVVSVEETKLAGMKGHRIVRRTHTFLMNAPEVARAVETFLREGDF